MPFQDFVNRVFEREGYRSNHPKDRGGLTIWGISSGSFPAEVAAMQRMSPEEARDYAAAIYRAKFWNRAQGDELEHLVGGDLADQVADWSITSYSAAFKTLQRMLNLFARSSGKWDVVNVDGIIGAETLAAVGRAILANPGRYRPLFPKTYRAMRMHFYIELTQQDPTQLAFIDGWLLRA